MVNMDVSMDRIVDICKNRGIRPSFIRVKILEYLMANRTHPTVDEIFSRLAGKIPTLSKTTIYNALGVFTDAGLVRVVTVEDNETRYDADVSDHGHFKCKQCGRIYDFTVDANGLEVDNLHGFRIEKRDVYFRGLCPYCNNN
jgi:Fur family peroxide stress response transcriptional regulator